MPAPSAITCAGDALYWLRGMEDSSVQCCVTSPPYYGLRDYGTATWEGGLPDCDHRKPGERRQPPHGDGRVSDSYAGNRVLIPGAGAFYGAVCGKCGARRVDGQLGHEPSPEQYVSRLVEVFREVSRVLKPDGTLWVVIGDSYTRDARKGQHRPGDSGKQAYIYDHGGGRAGAVLPGATGLKSKDLIGIPWLLAFALRSDGWYWRSEIIWAKPNPMPESVRDRCTRSHEIVLLMAKGGSYQYDSPAISEPSVTDDPRRPCTSKGAWELDGRPPSQRHGGEPRNIQPGSYYYDSDSIAEPCQTGPKENYPARSKSSSRGTQGGAAARGNDRDKSGGFPPREGLTRNKRDVWTIPTRSSP